MYEKRAHDPEPGRRVSLMPYAETKEEAGSLCSRERKYRNMEKILKVRWTPHWRISVWSGGIAAAYAERAGSNGRGINRGENGRIRSVQQCGDPWIRGAAHGKVDLEFALLSPDTLMIKVIDKGVGIENIARAMEPLFTTDTWRGAQRHGLYRHGKLHG